MSTSHGDSRCGSESEDHARYSHIQKRQDIPGNQMQSLEYKTPSYPSLIWKMKTYLDLEGRLGSKSRPQPQTQLQQTQSQQINPQQNQPQPAQPSTNLRVRKSPGPKRNVPDKKKKK